MNIRMEWKRYRSRKLVEAKQVTHDGSAWNPRTGQKEDFRSGDWLVRTPDGKQHVERQETFAREYEAID